MYWTASVKVNFKQLNQLRSKSNEESKPNGLSDPPNAASRNYFGSDHGSSGGTKRSRYYSKHFGGHRELHGIAAATDHRRRQFRVDSWKCGLGWQSADLGQLDIHYDCGGLVGVATVGIVPVTGDHHSSENR
jgi:hypothetical protein